MQIGVLCTTHSIVCSPLWLCHIFHNNYLVKVTMSRKSMPDLRFMSWYSLQLLSATFLHSGCIKWDIILNVLRSSCEVPNIFFHACNQTWIFKGPSIKSAHCGSQGGVLCRHMDRRTDMMNLIAFQNFARVLNKLRYFKHVEIDIECVTSWRTNVEGNKQGNKRQTCSLVTAELFLWCRMFLKSSYLTND